MANKVFMLSYPNDNLPGETGGIIDWARQETERLTGGAAGRVIHFIQENSREPEHRLTISVPESDAEALAALQANGAEPEFEEPGAPYTEGNQIVLPGSYQCLKFGLQLDPRAIQDNPMRLTLLCQAVGEAIPGLPPEAKDWNNWTWMEHDEDVGTFIITWEEPSPEAP